MSFLRRGNSCVAPDMEIRKRLEVSAWLISHIPHSFFVVFDRPLSLLWLIIHQNTAGSEIFWQSRQGRERKPDQGGMVQRSQLLWSPHNWVSKYFTFNKCRSSQRWRAVKKTYSWIFKTLSKTSRSIQDKNWPKFWDLEFIFEQKHMRLLWTAIVITFSSLQSNRGIQWVLKLLLFYSWSRVQTVLLVHICTNSIWAKHSLSSLWPNWC